MTLLKTELFLTCPVETRIMKIAYPFIVPACVKLKEPEMLSPNSAVQITVKSGNGSYFP